MLKIITSNIKLTIKFKKGNPIKWKDFQKHLKSLNIQQYGDGEAIDDGGSKHQLLAAIHKKGQIMYIPYKSEVLILGVDIKQISKLSKEIYAIIKELFKSAKRLKSNIKYYEIHLQQEVEPELASPLEILELITPHKMFKPFEGIFDDKKLGMFTYRFYYTSANVDDNIKAIIPWYDLRVFPAISNPDRFVFEIVCRDLEYETTVKKCTKLHSALNSYIEAQETKVMK